MALHCPACGGSELRVHHGLELPPDGESDEITVQTLRCGGCGLTALGLYEESRRGSSDDCWRHGGWRREEAEVARVEGQIARCPEPTRAACPCPVHAALQRLKVELHASEGRFPVRVARAAEAG